MKKAMSQKTLGVIISLTIAVILIVVVLTLVGPDKLTDMVSNSLDRWNVGDLTAP